MIITEPLICKHFTNSGDLIATMAGFKGAWELSGRKIVVLQQLNVKANYYPGAVHGTVDEEGTHVCMNPDIFEKMKPLVMSQEYIREMDRFVGQKIHVDIDVIRKKVFVNLPHGSIQAWPFYAFPDMAYDLTKPWITLKDEDVPDHIRKQVDGKVIVNFTERYRNANLNYFFLKRHQSKLVFAGTDREHLLFCNTWNVNMPKLEDANFLETAYALKTCKFLLCNQSTIWNIAEAMKTPRLLEVCEYAQNCLPFYGEKSYGFFHQEGLEYYESMLF